MIHYFSLPGLSNCFLYLFKLISCTWPASLNEAEKETSNMVCRQATVNSTKDEKDNDEGDEHEDTENRKKNKIMVIIFMMERKEKERLVGYVCRQF